MSAPLLCSALGSLLESALRLTCEGALLLVHAYHGPGPGLRPHTTLDSPALDPGAASGPCFLIFLPSLKSLLSPWPFLLSLQSWV